MADPMTNVEIEDVLSSIRRLVSEDSTALKARKPDRLILTQAYRVPAEPPAAPLTADAPALVLVAPVEAPPAAEPEEAPVAPPVADAVEAAPAAVVPASVPDPAPASDAPTLEDRIAALEAQISSSADEFEPDGVDDQPRHIPRSIFEPGSEADDSDPTPVPEAPAPQSSSDLAGAAARPVEGAASARPATLQVDEALIDEAVLREIVGSLVREELRGELGERITRNVRRLIRREIHRALTLQALEDDED